MPIALDCRYRERGVTDRLAIRDVHLSFMISVKDQILAGGASMEGSSIVGMYVLLATDDPAKADEFLANEPYTNAGLFAEIRQTFFTAFIPEPNAGFLNGLLDEARSVARRLGVEGPALLLAAAQPRPIARR